VTASYFFS